MTPYELVYEYVMQTGRCIFLTGKAGTGKTTLLRRLQRECPKQMAVVAPTGVAAINAEGVTIHSLFQLPPQLFIPTPEERKKLFAEMQMRYEKQRLLLNLELLIIDEVSMVRADLLDAIDAVLRRFKHRPSLPFGGVQVLFIGDLYQLSPVAREHEWDLLRPYYSGPYFFQAQVFQQLAPVYIELDHIYRQDNPVFINLLNEVRNNCLTPTSLALLNSRYQPDWKQLPDEPFHIILSTHNRKVDAINSRELDALDEKPFTFKATIEGNFPETQYPIEPKLVLKKGARVMFMKTDSSVEKRYYNGKLGIVTQLSKDKIVVESEDLQGRKEQITVHTETWEHIRYTALPNSDEVMAEVDGAFTQVPLRLAWAGTIHKAQGLTFDHVVIDAGDSFAAGQVYVALSRCRTLEGLVLLSPIPASALTNAREVQQFTNAQPSLEQVETGLDVSQREFLCQLLSNIYDFRLPASRTQSLQRLVHSSTSFNQATADAFLIPIQTDLDNWQRIALTFQQQLRQIIFTPNTDPLPRLKDRLSAANGYFIPKLQELQKTLKASPIYADDKAMIKEFEEIINELYADVLRQPYIMGEIAKEPTAQRYFIIRQAFKVPAPSITARAEQKTDVSNESQHPLLLKRLYALRREIAEEKNKLDAIYVIASNKTMVAISNALPTSKKEMLQVSGMGRKRYEVIGDRALHVVIQYLQEQNKKE